MKILVIAATDIELKPFLKAKHSCDILITGVGIAATVYQLQKKISQKKYDFIIQAGIAGTFDKTLDLGKTVIVKKDCFGDLGMEENGKFSTLFDNGFLKINASPYSNGWLVNSNKKLKQFSLPIVSAVTVQKVSDSKKQTKQLIETFQPTIESMEGAAFHYVCIQEKISFLQIRGISNHVGIRDKSTWKMKQAIENLNEELARVVLSLAV